MSLAQDSISSSSIAISRIREQLHKRGLSGYLATTPSNIQYVTGFRSYFVSEWWRFHGTVLAYVPADARERVVLVVGDFEAETARKAAPDIDIVTYRLWVDLATASEMKKPADPAAVQRPEQWDPDELDHAVRTCLQADSSSSSPLGTDLPYLTYDTWQRLQRSAPQVSWIDFSSDMYDIRLIKQEWEIDHLRTAVRLSERGMVAAMSTAREGMTAQDIRCAYQAGVAQAALGSPQFDGYTDNWVLPTVGGSTSASYGAAEGGLQIGDLVKFDCGTTVHGYRSDGGRTFAFGTPSYEAVSLYKVLQEAQSIARDALVPGALLSDAYTRSMEFVHDAGYPAYNRGHVGHSVGIDSFHEEPPFIGPNSAATVREGMVLAIEVPTYTPDVGAIMIEDLVVVRADGPEVLHAMPHGLTFVDPETGPVL